MGLFDWLGRRKNEKLASSLEGRGAFREASEAWKRAGQPGKASASLFRLASETGDTRERLNVLGRACELALPGTEEKRAALRLSAELLVEYARDLAKEVPAWLRVDLRRVARECEAELDHLNARAIFEILGDREGLVRVLTQAGEVDELERLLSLEISAGAEAQKTASARRGAELAFESGDRRRALLQFQELGDATRVESIEIRRPGGNQLKIAIEGRRTTMLLLGPGDEVTIGRSEGQVRIDSASVSRKHLRIERVNGRYRLTDLGSRNQTRIRGVPIVVSMEVDLPTSLELAPGIEVKMEGASHPNSVLLSIPGEEILLVFDTFSVKEGWTLRRASDNWYELALEAPAFLGGRVEVGRIATLLVGDRFSTERGALPLLEVLA